MVKKICVRCGENAFHNITKKENKVTGERCTKCGFPHQATRDETKRFWANQAAKRFLASVGRKLW